MNIRETAERIVEESGHEKIEDLLPDSATCKHAETGESLLDNIRDLVRDVANLERDLKRTGEALRALLAKRFMGLGGDDAQF